MTNNMLHDGHETLANVHTQLPTFQLRDMLCLVKKQL
jgi:hypothetical protein